MSNITIQNKTENTLKLTWDNILLNCKLRKNHIVCVNYCRRNLTAFSMEQINRKQKYTRMIRKGWLRGCVPLQWNPMLECELTCLLKIPMAIFGGFSISDNLRPLKFPIALCLHFIYFCLEYIESLISCLAFVEFIHSS